MRSVLTIALALLLCVAPIALLCGASNSRSVTQIYIPMWVDPPIQTRTPHGLRVTLNGKPTSVTHVLAPTSDIVVLLVLDVTGDVSLVNAAKQALMTEIDALPRNAWVGLLRAQNGLAVVADPTPDRIVIRKALQTLPETGKPGLLDSIVPVARLADGILQHSGVRVAVLYITDSDIYNYREDFTNPVINSSDPHDLSRRFPEALIEEKISSVQMQISYEEAPLFIVHLRYRTNRMNQAYQNGLKELSEFSAGYSWTCRSDAEIPDAIRRMFAYVRSAWFLTLRVPKGGSDRVQVRLRFPERTHLRIAYRARLLLKTK